MELEDILNILEIDEISDFSFFEHYAELVETEEDIPLELLAQFLDDIDSDVLTELTEGYFEDILKYIPDDAVDFYTLLSTIGQTLVSLAGSDDLDNSSIYAEEFYKFRNWYTFDSEVHCTQISNNTIVECTISQALTLYRLENLNEEEYEYDFSDCLDYSLDEYIVNVASLSDDDIEADEPYDDIDD
jgi:hypothetical protein